jgi:hypothetical protein
MLNLVLHLTPAPVNVAHNQARRNMEWPERESLFTTLYEET